MNASALRTLRAGVLAWLLLAPAVPSAQHGAMLLDRFDTGAPTLDWYVLNDEVMGGRSEGGYRLEAGALVFAGVTNTNGGGFSSIRTRPRTLDLSGRRAIVVHGRGDGRRYVFRLETDDGTAYWADFDPPADAPGEVRIPLDRFRPRFRGRWLSGPPLDPARVTRVGLMCYDGRDGPFRLEVHRIEAG
jgi:monofunctional biosynthetic peptidoglycan transglycosylase